jgi:hypothetical protein
MRILLVVCGCLLLLSCQAGMAAAGLATAAQLADLAGQTHLIGSGNEALGSEIDALRDMPSSTSLDWQTWGQIGVAVAGGMLGLNAQRNRARKKRGENV